MALVLADRVKETTTTTGTGTVTLLGAATGYQSFAAVGNGNTTYYCIAGQTGSEWEVGIGTYTAVGTTLARTTVLASSNAGSLVTFSAGTKDVFVTQPAKRAVYDSTGSTGGTDSVSTNTANTVVRRDASGNFSAGTVTAALSGNATTATSSPKVSTADLRGTALTPSYFGQGLNTAFMANATDGLSDGGTYHGIIQFQQWTDATGGGAAELAITDNNNVWHRGSSGALTTWSTWYKFLDTGNYNSYAPTLTGTGASGTWSINVTGSAGSATTATTATNLAGGSAGTIPYQSAAGTTVQLAAGTAGYFLQANGAAAPSWVASPGAQANGVIYENGKTISSNYTLTTNKNGLSVGPITISSGVSVTVPSGQRWVVL